MRHWWKFLALGLLLFASIAALRAPLAPALVHVSPDRLPAGEATLSIKGYNTGFTDAYNVYLINGGDRICASSVNVISADRIDATFIIPEGLKENMSSVVVHEPGVGRLGLPSAVFHSTIGAGVSPGDCEAATTATLGSGEFNFPNRSILYESIRNLNFHVPMWFTMMAIMAVSLYHSIRTLSTNDLRQDRGASVAVHVGLLFCGMGLATGSVWARATWGAWWTNDVKLNGAAVTALIYLAYLVLRGSVTEPHRRAKLSAVYNIFAFMLLVLFLLVVPRLNQIDSLHPGSGGNPAFNQYDLDDNLRMVFYPAVAGWILLSLWLYRLRFRMLDLQDHLEERTYATVTAPTPDHRFTK
jgi:heme exporter protein C